MKISQGLFCGLTHYTLAFVLDNRLALFAIPYFGWASRLYGAGKVKRSNAKADFNEAC